MRKLLDIAGLVISGTGNLLSAIYFAFIYQTGSKSQFAVLVFNGRDGVRLGAVFYRDEKKTTYSARCWTSQL
jgi:hypothetical protein